MTCANEIVLAQRAIDFFGGCLPDETKNNPAAQLEFYTASNTPSDDEVDEYISGRLGITDVDPETGEDYIPRTYPFSAANSSPADLTYLRKLLTGDNSLWQINEKQDDDHWYALLTHPAVTTKMMVEAANEAQLLTRAIFHASQKLEYWGEQKAATTEAEVLL